MVEIEIIRDFYINIKEIEVISKRNDFFFRKYKILLLILDE